MREVANRRFRVVCKFLFSGLGSLAVETGGDVRARDVAQHMEVFLIVDELFEVESSRVTFVVGFEVGLVGIEFVEFEAHLLDGHRMHHGS